jgi:hypothetical protein
MSKLIHTIVDANVVAPVEATGEVVWVGRPLGRDALELVEHPSERGPGANYAVLRHFDTLLSFLDVLRYP